MDEREVDNGTTTCFHQVNQTNNSFITIHFLIGDRKEVASFQPDQVTDSDIKELFRNAAEAGPLDIVKLRKANRLVNISSHLPGNLYDEPYVLQVVGIHPDTSGMIKADLLHALERRIEVLERELHDHREALAAATYPTLHELDKQINSFRIKLETTEHLSWLGFYKQLPEPVSSAACRHLQYRRKSNSLKRRIREKFFNICDVVLTPHVREWIRSPAFDTRQWEDEELLLILQMMFLELELPQKYNIALSTLRNFIFEVYNNYNEVPFHNFRHCFCVAQMMYAIVWAVDLVSKIGELEVLILLVSCICHDLDHPGYNNIYQINARTELALRYNDISPLENHHCSVAFRVLEIADCNILASLDSITYRTVREGIIRCILATDMARHNEILAQFTDTISDFDYTNKAHINLLSMILIKVADISNEARPMDVAEPWLDNLLQEFFKQSDAEKLEGLPVTPFMDRDKVTKPSSQCSFIGLVLLPLFEALGELMPQLQELIVEPVRYALDYYRRLNETAKDERHQRKSVVELVEQALGSQSMISKNKDAASTEYQEQLATFMNCSSIHSTSKIRQQLQHHHYYDHHQQQSSTLVKKSPSMHSICSGGSVGMLHLHSHSIEDEEKDSKFCKLLTSEEMVDLSSSDPETATEVEISEKTLKFKISTEGASGPVRKSYPGSRKGSREKSSLDYHNYELAKSVRDNERRKSRGENLYSELNSPQSARSSEEMRILEELERDDQHHVELLFDESQCHDSVRNGCFIQSTAQQRHNKCLNKRTLSCDSTMVKADCYRSSNSVSLDTDPVVNIAPGKSNSFQKNQVQYADTITYEQLAHCCCDDNPGINNHKSLLSRFRNFTDRLSISFDSKDIQVPKNIKYSTAKNLNKSLSMNATSASSQQQTLNNVAIICKKCHLSKSNEQFQKRSLTLPKVKNGKPKGWRTVFAKERKPSVSLETLPADDVFVNTGNLIKSQRSLPNTENRIFKRNAEPTMSLACISFKEIHFRLSKPEIFIDQFNPSSSNPIDDIGIVEIRRSSTSMEDISKITEQDELGQVLVDCPLEQNIGRSNECQQHAGSLESMLYKETQAIHGQDKYNKPIADRKLINLMTDSPTQPKKSFSGLFSRFKTSMTIDDTRSSNSGSLHEQQQQGWIGSLTASLRPKRQVCEQPEILPQSFSPSH